MCIPALRGDMPPWQFMQDLFFMLRDTHLLFSRSSNCAVELSHCYFHPNPALLAFYFGIV